MHAHYLDAIKGFEGFASRASWDYAQHSNGFGTRALHPGEQISREEAERRFAAEMEQARRFVDAQAAGWDEGTKAALTSLTFNTGTKWASSGLGEAVRNGNIDDVRSRLLTYTKAGGKELPGLVRRRQMEAAWIGQTKIVASLEPRVAAMTSDALTVSSERVSRLPRRLAPATTHNLEPAAPSAGRIVTGELSAAARILLLLDVRSTPAAQTPARSIWGRDAART